ncbi:Acg family FMN-binding oxidoreductase [Nocardia fluminea]|uniref:Acg family FMN-binding oxidoreductase n=1 Tax=Nocardia fluminea TaxID=134984 RepID=UPI0033CEF365
MERGLPDDNTVMAALRLAGRAPSVHNVQPWRWRIADESIHLYLDPRRALPATDPDQRDIVLSCGAALHHLSVALTAMGWAPVVHRIPDPADPDHLAAVTLLRRRPTSLDIEMSKSITARKTDRRHYTSWPVPPGYLSLFTERAMELGAIVRRIDDRERVKAAAAHAGRIHADDESYRFELAMWSGRHGSADGVPARNAPPARPADDFPPRTFAAAEFVDPASEPDQAGARHRRRRSAVETAGGRGAQQRAVDGNRHQPGHLRAHRTARDRWTTRTHSSRTVVRHRLSAGHRPGRLGTDEC